MMQEIGVVIAKEGHYATVQVERRSACALCHKEAGSCDACSLFITNASHKVIADNAVDANVGDTVILQATTQKILFYAFLIFFLPLVSAACFYLIAYFALRGESYITILCGLGGLLLSYAVISPLASRAEQKKRTVHIVRVLSNREQHQTEGEGQEP